MKHWLDMTDFERLCMTPEEQDACIKASLEHDLEIMENVIAGTWVRTPWEVVYKLPNCHDFGYTEQ